MEAAPGFEPGDNSFADCRLSSWLCRRVVPKDSNLEPGTYNIPALPVELTTKGRGETRTHNLGIKIPSLSR